MARILAGYFFLSTVFYNFSEKAFQKLVDPYKF